MNSIRHTILYSISTILDKMRYWDWYPVLRQNIIAALILLVFTNTHFEFIFTFLFYVVFLHIAFSFGFLVNGIADRKIDAKVGKGYLNAYSVNSLSIIAIILFTLLIILPLYFNNIGIMLTVLLGLLLGVFYSIRPIRLKERGFYGILSSVLSQRSPFLLFFFLMPNSQSFTLYLFFWLIFDGILIEFAHQISDRTNDVKTHTKTFVAINDRKKIKKLLQIFTTLYLIYIIVPLISLSLAGITLTILVLFFSISSLRITQLSLNTLSTHE